MDEYFDQNSEAKKLSMEQPLMFWEDPEHYDPITPDARLTELGKTQAAKLPDMLGDPPFCSVAVA